MSSVKTELKKHRQTLIQYLFCKLQMEDWHGVRDVCVDIEIIEAQLNILEKINELTK